MELKWRLALAILVCLAAVSINAVPVDDPDDDYETETMEEPGPIPEFTSSSQHFKVRDGDTVRLPCDVNDLGEYTLLWKRDEGVVLTAGSVLIARDPRYSHEGNSIIIRGVNPTDQGTYTCQISSTPPKELVHTIQVLVPPSARPVPSNGLVVAQKGQPVTLQCNVSGNPVPTVTWTRHGSKKFPDGRTSETGTSLTFSAVDRHHAGVYECQAENGQDTPAKASLNLQIIYEPVIEVEKTTLTSGEGLDTELTCNVHGEPKPTVSWHKNGAPVENSDRLSVSHSGSRHVLSIKEINAADFANYSCIAENSHGRQEQVIELTDLPSVAVLKRHKPISHGVELEWATESFYPVTQYRLRYTAANGKQDELLLNSSAQEKQGLVYARVHQLHSLQPSTSYELTIETKNSAGWSKPAKFTVATLTEEVPKMEKPERVSSGSTAVVKSRWFAAIATLVFVFTTL